VTFQIQPANPAFVTDLKYSKTKISWFPGRDIEFKGKNSPPPTNYSPKEDKDFPNLHFSVGR
jgi:hypothetical protein